LSLYVVPVFYAIAKSAAARLFPGQDREIWWIS
jgi:hypothetical protein